MSSVFISLHYGNGKEVVYPGYRRQAVSEWKVVGEHPLILANKNAVRFAEVPADKGVVKSFGVSVYKDSAPVLDASLDKPLKLEQGITPGFGEEALAIDTGVPLALIEALFNMARPAGVEVVRKLLET